MNTQHFTAFVKTFFLLIACVVHFPIITRGQEKATDTESARFTRWGIAFNYPAGWNEYPADRVALMKSAIAGQLRPFHRDLLEFAVFTAPGDEMVLIISKYTTPRVMKPSQFIDERKNAYQEAKRSGDVTKVNYVKETSVSKLAAVDEDVERSNGGRGRTLKIIRGNTVFELSFVVQRATAFSAHSNAMNQLIASVVIATPGFAETKEPSARNDGSKAISQSQFEQNGPDSSAVMKLLESVNDVSELEAALGKARQGDKVAAFLAISMRNAKVSKAAQGIEKDDESAEAVKVLLKRIEVARDSAKADEQLACANAVYALGKLGRKAADAIPTLKKLEKHSDVWIASAATTALEQITNAIK